MATQPWPSEWLPGTLTLAVLRVLVDGPTYGYAIASALSEAGFGDIKGGTLYPLLSRLETQGLVQTEWREGDGGPGRTHLLLSDDGRQHYATQAAQWRAFCIHTMGFIDPDQPHRKPEA